MFQALQAKLLQHKYAIDSAMLGDANPLAWSNLGLWQLGDSYPQACQNLAQHLAQQVQLSSHDHVLDLACGQGASLALWHHHYHVQSIHAVELQATLVEQIKRHAPFLSSIQCGSFLNLPIHPQRHYDVVLCIDAAYHVNVLDFLRSVQQVAQAHTRLGFHTLIFSPQYAKINSLQQQQYRYLLKAADVDLHHLSDAAELERTMSQHGLCKIEIQDLSAQVLQGFADYAEQAAPRLKGIDGFKIKMTAKLCRKLFDDGLIRYVAVTGQFN